MNIIVNGEELNIKNETTVEELLEQLEIKEKVMAVLLIWKL